MLYGAASLTVYAGANAVRLAGASTVAQSTFLSLSLMTGTVDTSVFLTETVSYEEQLGAYTEMAQDLANEAIREHGILPVPTE